MKKFNFDDIGYELDDVDSELAEMVRSLTFRNRPGNKRYRFSDDERPAKRKRKHRQTRHDELDNY